MSNRSAMRLRFDLCFYGVQESVAFVDQLVSRVGFFFVDFNSLAGVRGDAALCCGVNCGDVAVAREDKEISESGSRSAIEGDPVDLLVAAEVPASVELGLDERCANLVACSRDLDLARCVFVFFLVVRFLTVGLAGDREACKQDHCNAGNGFCEVFHTGDDKGSLPVSQDTFTISGVVRFRSAAAERFCAPSNRWGRGLESFVLLRRVPAFVAD